jgi:regulatory protein
VAKDAPKGTAFDCALRLLSLRDHAEAELRRKLREKGYQEGVEESIVRLKELRYLDDARFARSFAESSLRNGRGFGVRLKMELSRRGVAEPVIRQALAELAELDEEYGEQAVLAQTIERRFASFDAQTATDKEKRKVISYLQRKGFTLSAILSQLKFHSI